MAMFHYEATDPNGKTLVGSMDARDHHHVHHTLQQRGLTPTLVEPSGSVRGAPPVQAAMQPNAAPTMASPAANASAVATPSFAPAPSHAYASPLDPGNQPGIQFSPLSANLSVNAKATRRAGVVVKPQVLAQFYQQLAGMTRSGVPLTQALPHMAAGVTDKSLKAAVRDMETAVTHGRPLSEAMAGHPRVFSPGHVGLVQAGESAGFLDRALMELAVQAEGDYGLQNQYNLSIFYARYLLGPFAVLIMAFAIKISMHPAEQAEKFKEIPGAAAFALAVAVGAFLVFNVFLPLAWTGLRGTKFGGSIDSIIVSLPIFGTTRRKKDRARVLGSLASSLGAGVPLSSAWQLAVEAADTAFARKKLSSQTHLQRGGAAIPEVMRATNFFDNNTLQLAFSGEMSGSLPEALRQASNFQREEANYSAKKMSTIAGFLIVLFVIVCIGAFILWFYLKGAGASQFGGADVDLSGFLLPHL